MSSYGTPARRGRRTPPPASKTEGRATPSRAAAAPGAAAASRAVRPAGAPPSAPAPARGSPASALRPGRSRTAFRRSGSDAPSPCPACESSRSSSRRDM
ncbi:hypothetical protein FE782_00970 [Paenibacillus antri]|uniref:Uncharacterized protein n=1 Tax=Paenibacillus antri TaxID=2582848 RepID=A0A5R9GBV8_9BACL|nr:hypothetical protein FE782_00970 [Paenibacillus antri]